MVYAYNLIWEISIFHEFIEIKFRFLKLLIAIAIPESNEGTNLTESSAGEGLPFKF